MCTSHVCAHRTLQRVPLNTRYIFKQSGMFNGVGINSPYVAMCTCRCVHRTIKRPCEARYTKPAESEASAALEASAAHKYRIKCKAIVGTSAVHMCCAHARTCTACLFAHINMKLFSFFKTPSASLAQHKTRGFSCFKTSKEWHAEKSGVVLCVCTCSHVSVCVCVRALYDKFPGTFSNLEPSSYSCHIVFANPHVLIQFYSRSGYPR